MLTRIPVNQAMLRTSRDLLIKFNPATVYTASDEITLLFQPIVSASKVHYHLH